MTEKKKKKLLEQNKADNWEDIFDSILSSKKITLDVIYDPNGHSQPTERDMELSRDVNKLFAEYLVALSDTKSERRYLRLNPSIIPIRNLKG